MKALPARSARPPRAKGMSVPRISIGKRYIPEPLLLLRPETTQTTLCDVILSIYLKSEIVAVTVDSKCFWRWCITLTIAGFSESVSVALVLMHLVLSARFITWISASLSVIVLRMCMLYHNFYCIFSCYLASTKSGLRYLHNCSESGMGCPVIEVSSF
jgi:hypothetical protein